MVHHNCSFHMCLAPGLQAAAFYQYEDCPDSDEEMEVGLGSTSDAEASTLSEKRVCRAPDLDDVSSATSGAWEGAAGEHAGSSAAGGVSLLIQDRLLFRVLLADQKVLRVYVWLTVHCVVSWASSLSIFQVSGRQLHATPTTRHLKHCHGMPCRGRRS